MLAQLSEHFLQWEWKQWISFLFNGRKPGNQFYGVVAFWFFNLYEKATSVHMSKCMRTHAHAHMWRWAVFTEGVLTVEIGLGCS